MAVTVDEKFFLQGLSDYVAWPKISAAVSLVKEASFGFQQLAYIVELISVCVISLEKMVSEAGDVAKGAGASKKAALVKFLDDTIKLPMFLEPFDGPIFSAMIEASVKLVNFR